MQTVVRNLLTNYHIYENKNPKGTILILHGWWRSSGDWTSISKQLNKDYQVVTIDLPGFGGTLKPEEDWDIYRYSDFFNEFCQKLNLQNIIFLGHSFGGRIGIISASRTNLIEKLILVDSGGIEVKSMKVRVKTSIVKLAKPFGKFLPNKIQGKLKSKIGSSDYNQAGDMKNTFVKVINEDLTPLFKEVKIPSLIVWGSKDQTLSVQQTKIFNREIPNSEVRIVWEAGHHPHLDNERLFLEIISEYLSESSKDQKSNTK